MVKTELKIRIIGDPVLRKKAHRVERVSDKHREVLSAMAQLMYASSGIGLAAPQVGVPEAMIVVDCGTGLYKLINPRIVKKAGQQAIEEGCLSVPGICVKVKRAQKIKVEAWDESGRPVIIDAEDLLACVIQHEMDHLKGNLIVDYASFLQKMKIKNKLRELKKIAKDERLPESEAKSCKLQL